MRLQATLCGCPGKGILDKAGIIERHISVAKETAAGLEIDNVNLHIYYLHYNTQEFEGRSRDPQKRRPDWFSYNVCLMNVLKTITHRLFTGKVYFTLWHDGALKSNSLSKEVLAAIGAAEQSGVAFNVLIGEFGSGAKSAHDLHYYIAGNTNIADDDLVYTLENDYLHQDGWLEKVEELVDSGIPFDYISLYDHADNYLLNVHKNFKNQMFFTRSNLWRTCFSTCYSKLAKCRTIKEDLAILNKYDDFLACALFNLKNRVLMVSTPGLSTHAMAGLESPSIDWNRIASG